MLGTITLGLALLAAWRQFPIGVIAFACVALALYVALFGLVHRGVIRALALSLALVLVAGSAGLLFAHDGVLTVAVARRSCCSRSRPRAPRFVHVSSFRPDRVHGDPCSSTTRARAAVRPSASHIAAQARARGIEPVELAPGTDLEELVHEAVSRGADALAMAGGDGSQAVVAAIAAEHALPYACVPAGTRNHFALDLGVDRDDVVGALDALVDGGERVVDLAEVNGRVFVNNVSLGVYGEAVQRPGYREAKLRNCSTRSQTSSVQTRIASRCAGPTRMAGSARVAQRCWSPTTATAWAGCWALEPAPAWTRVLLGVIVADAPTDARARRLQALAPVARVDGAVVHGAGAERVAAGIDGEAAQLQAPLRFRIRARVR